MEAVITDLLVIASFILVFVTAMVELVKKTFKDFPTRFLPITALVIGILLGYLSWASFDMGITLPYAIWGGAIAGLASVGLFEGITKIVPGITRK